MFDMKSVLSSFLLGPLVLAPGALSQYATTNGVKFEANGQTFNYAGTNVYDGMKKIATVQRTRSDSLSSRISNNSLCSRRGESRTG